MHYWTLAYQPWHKRCAITLSDFMRTVGRKARGVHAIRTADGNFHTQYRLTAPTRRELDQAMADYLADYPYRGYETRVLYEPRFYRGMWTATMKRANKC